MAPPGLAVKSVSITGSSRTGERRPSSTSAVSRKATRPGSPGFRTRRTTRHEHSDGTFIEDKSHELNSGPRHSLADQDERRPVVRRLALADHRELGLSQGVGSRPARLEVAID